MRHLTPGADRPNRGWSRTCQFEPHASIAAESQPQRPADDPSFEAQAVMLAEVDRLDVRAEEATGVEAVIHVGATGYRSLRRNSQTALVSAAKLRPVNTSSTRICSHAAVLPRNVSGS